MITIYQGNTHLLESSDINIVIDVIRAFTVAHYAFINGTKQILLVETTEDAFSIKNEYPHYLLAGEEDGIGIKGFDYDNSPKRISKERLNDQTLVQKTTNGVKATLNSLNTNHLFVTGYSNARTTAFYVKKIYNASLENLKINIVASHPSGDDDLACAEYMKGLILEKNNLTPFEVEQRIKNSHVAHKFFDPNNIDFNCEDISLCSLERESNFVMKVNQSNQIPVIERINI
ncbi:2-phosphosulfolactate phosphatase [Halalkalibacter alkalisediminis]|uniref:Probable 2-phosphosulfolactate phosphatase n=1 Tax=Halalkalibacter alkalisediminis TaxID=935616 RepID=A0ABV6NH77_9BACI|nr:2-phosphosulfolactate phosphatase [Halalkalibacter alkalisediminis]